MTALLLCYAAPAVMCACFVLGVTLGAHEEFGQPDAGLIIGAAVIGGAIWPWFLWGIVADWVRYR